MSNSFVKLTCLLTALVLSNSVGAAPNDTPPARSVRNAKKTNAPANLTMPTGFSATIVAEELGSARHIVVSKTGDIYVKLAKLKDGKGIYRLRDTDKDGIIDERTGFGD